MLLNISLVLLVAMATVSQGKSVYDLTLKKVPNTADQTLYIKPVDKRKRLDFVILVNDLLSYTGTLPCELNSSTWITYGLQKRACSMALLALLHAYCQWLVESGEDQLDEFCYAPPLNYPKD